MAQLRPDLLERGYFKLASFAGAPIRVHFLVPLGWLMVLGTRPTGAECLGLFLVVLLHELGHAVAVKWAGASVTSVDLLPFGGVCRWSGQVSPLDRAWIASAGIVAQLLLWGAAKALLFYRGPELNDFTLDLLWVFTRWNLWMAALNLIPFPPFDGAEAWKLPVLLFGKKQIATPATLDARPENELRRRLDAYAKQFEESDD